VLTGLNPEIDDRPCDLWCDFSDILLPTVAPLVDGLRLPGNPGPEECRALEVWRLVTAGR